MTVIGLDEFIGHSSLGLERQASAARPTIYAKAKFSPARAQLAVWGLAAVAALQVSIPFVVADAPPPPRDRPSDAPFDPFALNLGPAVMEKAWQSALARIHATGDDAAVLVRRAGENLSASDPGDDTLEDDKV